MEEKKQEQTNKQKYGQTQVHTNRQIRMQVARQMDGQTDKIMEKNKYQTNKNRDKQTDKIGTDRQT